MEPPGNRLMNAPGLTMCVPGRPEPSPCSGLMVGSHGAGRFSNVTTGQSAAGSDVDVVVLAVVEAGALVVDDVAPDVSTEMVVAVFDVSEGLVAVVSSVHADRTTSSTTEARRGRRFLRIHHSILAPRTTQKGRRTQARR